MVVGLALGMVLDRALISPTRPAPTEGEVATASEPPRPANPFPSRAARTNTAPIVVASGRLPLDQFEAAFNAGGLGAGEFGARAQKALAATGGELAALVADLPEQAVAA